jgi:hypothetical protein
MEGAVRSGRAAAGEILSGAVAAAASQPRRGEAVPV